MTASAAPRVSTTTPGKPGWGGGRPRRWRGAPEVGEGGVHDEFCRGVAVGGGDQLNAGLGDGAGGGRLEVGADLVDDDDLGHVVLDGLDHDGVLEVRAGYLHAAGAADARVRDVAVAG